MAVRPRSRRTRRLPMPVTAVPKGTGTEGQVPLRSADQDTPRRVTLRRVGVLLPATAVATDSLCPSLPPLILRLYNRVFRPWVS